MLYGDIFSQRLTLVNTHVVADTIDYLEVKFFFKTNDWDGLEKWVHFANSERVYDIRLSEDGVQKEDHLNLTAGKWRVYLHGNRYENGQVIERITTDEAVIYVAPTGALNGEPFPEMPASVTEQILARLDEVEQNGGGTGDGYSPEAKVERVEGGVRVTITDKDGTTSEVVQDGQPGVHVGSDAPPKGTKVWVNPNGKRTEIPRVDDTLTQPGYAADAKEVGKKINQLSEGIAEQGKTIPKVFDWALAELPFTESEISGTASGAGFVVNPTNFADGKTYFRYHAGASYGFRWTNPNPQKGSLTITMRGYSQYSETLSTKIVTVYTDGTDNSLTNMMYLKHGETVTYTTDPDKTVAYIRGNYDFENWVLLDMDVLSIVADYPAPTGTVRSVNGVEPDENGNVEIDIPEGGGSGGTDIRENEKWEKIYEVTVSERVSYIEFNEDSEGNPFALRKMRAFLILPEWVSEDGETKGTGYAYYNINGKRPAYQTPSIGWDKATFIFEAEVYGDYYIAKAYKDGSNGANYTGFFHYDMFKSAGSFDAINSFRWQIFNKDVMPNSKFIIYGVKV